ncbi:MAG: sugar ABC transporter permease [Chloroflexota bacterium]|nr:sugar ABC transporter permease [Chloroflexota bacterium]
MAVQTQNRPAGDAARTFDAVPLIAGLLALIGLGLIGALVNGIIEVLNVRGVDENLGTTLLRFLNTYGIVVPLLQIAFGIGLLRLTARFMRRNIVAAVWARQFLLWMLVLVAVLTLQAFNRAFSSDPDAFGLGLGLALGLAVTLAAYWWIGANLDRFDGIETLEQTNARSAWNLLVPTLILLVLVAARPLEATFIASLTDRRFASADEYGFVGIENYARLLGVRLDVIDCTPLDAGGCQIDEAGAVVYPRPRDVLDESYRELRFRDIGVITVGSSQLIISARDRDFFEAIGNTLLFTVISVTLELIFGLFVAMVINSKFPGRGIMRAAMLVPWAIPTIVSAKLWDVMLQDNRSGVVNDFLIRIGFIAQSQAWLAQTNLQIPALIAIDVWKTTPFMALILLAGLQTIPGDIYEAADVDGANKMRQFFQLTLPLLRPTVAVALVFRTLDAVRVFDVFQVLLERQRLSMATYNYYTLVSSQELGYASAIGVVIFIIILLFTVGYVRILGVSAE